MKSQKRRSVAAIVFIAGVLLIGVMLVTAVGGQGGTNVAFAPVVFHLYEDTGEPPTTPEITPTSTRPPTVTPTATPTPVPRHYDDCAFRTGNNATIGVPEDVTIVGGLALEVDDELAVFTPDGALCAGMTVWDGNNVAITAWGDDEQTDAIDGLQSGEEMQFRIWDDSAGTEYIVSEVTFSLGDGIYVADSIQIVESFTLP